MVFFVPCGAIIVLRFVPCVLPACSCLFVVVGSISGEPKWKPIVGDILVVVGTPFPPAASVVVVIVVIIEEGDGGDGGVDSEVVVAAALLFVAVVVAPVGVAAAADVLAAAAVERVVRVTAAHLVSGTAQGLAGFLTKGFPLPICILATRFSFGKFIFAPESVRRVVAA